MNLKSIIVIVVTLTVLAAAGFAGYYFFIREEPKSLETVSVSDIFQLRSAPFFIADELGYYKDEGLNVNIVKKNKGGLAIDALESGELNFGYASPISLIPRMITNNNIVILAEIHYSDDNASVIGRKDSGINKVEDLKGKKVGVQIGADSTYFLGYLLELHGLTIKDVQLVNVTPDQYLPFMQNGTVDAVSLWRPYSTEVKNTMKDKISVFSSDDTYYSMLVLLTRRDWAEQNPEIVEKFMRATKKAIDYINNNRDKAFKISSYRSLRANPAWTREDLENSWKASIFMMQLEPSLINRLAETYNWMTKYGFLKFQKEPNFLTHIYMKPLRDISPNSVLFIETQNENKN